jgi:hypothetical protein
MGFRGFLIEGKIPDYSQIVSDLNKEFDDDFVFPADEATEMVGSAGRNMKTYYNFLVKRFSNSSLRVYRTLAVNNPKSFAKRNEGLTKNFGKHWSTEIIEDSGNNIVVLVADVPVSKIDVRRSMWQSISIPYEQEVYIDAAVKCLKIFVMDKGESWDEFRERIKKGN